MSTTENKQRLAELTAELDAPTSEPAAESGAVPLVKVGDVIHATATGLTISRTASLWGGLPPLLLTRGDRIEGGPQR